ncbi:MAG: EF-hand domain-containing protein [Phycisphaerales bacterium]
MVNRTPPASRRILGSSAALLVLATAAGAQDLVIGPPSVDRWMYPFASGAGTRSTAPAFASLNLCGTDDRFDDRDAQFLVIFNTTGAVAPGAAPESYAVSMVRLTVSVCTDVNVGTTFTYDGTHDQMATYLAAGDAAQGCGPDPARVPDADSGRPVELFAVAYRNGFTPLTYLENSPFKPGSAFNPPWINVRNAFPMWFDVGGQALDASNHVKARTELVPLAVGQSSTPAGGIPQDGAIFTFDLDLSNPGVRAYVQQGLAIGRVALLVTSMAFAEQETVGSYPTFYAREAVGPLFPNASAPALMITLDAGEPCATDFNNDGFVEPGDLDEFITAFFSDNEAERVRCDFNGDGFVEPGDLDEFITAFFEGC